MSAFRVLVVQIAGVIPIADDIQRNGGHQFQLVGFGDEAGEVLCLFEVATDELFIFPDAVLFEQHPDFQGTETAG